MGDVINWFFLQQNTFASISMTLSHYSSYLIHGITGLYDHSDII
jgi:hypothetical protein